MTCLPARSDGKTSRRGILQRKRPNAPPRPDRAMASVRSARFRRCVRRHTQFGAVVFHGRFEDRLHGRRPRAPSSPRWPMSASRSIPDVGTRHQQERRQAISMPPISPRQGYAPRPRRDRQVVGGSTREQGRPRSLRALQAVIENHFVHAPPFEVEQQLPQSAFHPVEVEVMPKAGLGVDPGDPRLRGVDLPGMEIEDRRLPVDVIDAAQQPSRHRIRHEPKIPAAARRPVAAEQAHRRHRHFEQPLTHIVSEARRVGRAVVIVPDRVDAGAVPVAGSLDAFERPFVFVADRKLGAR